MEGGGSASAETQNERHERDQEIVQSKLYEYQQIMFIPNVPFFYNIIKHYNFLYYSSYFALSAGSNSALFPRGDTLLNISNSEEDLNYINSSAGSSSDRPTSSRRVAKQLFSPQDDNDMVNMHREKYLFVSNIFYL